MCELLGMCFNKKISPWVSFRGFKRRGRGNPHGWGIGYYPDEACQVIKEPLQTTQSELAGFIENYSKEGKIKSRIIIAHVRNASIGNTSFKNTHPFKREIFGKEYIFAHNGTVEKNKIPEASSEIFYPVGQTDSEKIFCYLLNLFYQKNIKKWSESLLEWLSGILLKINEQGKLNLLFSDGELLFAYHDMNGYNGLYLLERKAPYGEIELVDEDYRINLAEEKSEDTKGYIIATRPITKEERWEEFCPGELIVFKNGKIIYSSRGRILIEKISDIEKEILKILRKSPHRLSLKEIIKAGDYSENLIKKSIHKLLKNKFIVQDSIDKVRWDNPNATFYTNPERRKLIEAMLKK